MSVWRAVDPAAFPSGTAVLILDRDGVVVREAKYLADPAGLQVLPGAAAAMRRARERGYRLVGVSNQSGIGRGLFTHAQLAAVMRRLDGILDPAGAGFDGFYYCPHAPQEGCACRKPDTGLLQEAGILDALDRGRSWMVGDKDSDVALGRVLGVGAILVRTGYGASLEAEVRRRWADDPAVRVAPDLAAAVDMILARGGRTGP